MGTSMSMLARDRQADLSGETELRATRPVGAGRLVAAGLGLRRRFYLFLLRGQLGPTRELELRDFLPNHHWPGR